MATAVAIARREKKEESRKQSRDVSKNGSPGSDGDQSVELPDRTRPPSPLKVELEGKSTYDKILDCDKKIIEKRRDRDNFEKLGKWQNAHSSQLQLETLQKVRQELHPQIQLRKKLGEKVKLERKLANAKKTKHYLDIDDIVRKIDQKKKEVEAYNREYDEYKQDEGKASRWKAAMNWIFHHQNYAHAVYLQPSVQIGVAVLIFVNFIINVFDAQKNPPPVVRERYKQGLDPHFNDVLLGAELFFAAAFTLELILNMYANWFTPFWSDGWNVFDFIVVGISIISLPQIPVDLPGISVLRLLRAFRVFRLFKRLENLRKIISCIERAIPGVANAFGILVLVMSIYAILGVEFFSLITLPGDCEDESDCKPYRFGVEYYGSFGRAFFTLFQVMTGDSWASVIAWPCVRKNPWSAFYYILYLIMSMIVLANIAIAVLLNEFVAEEPVQNDEEEDDDIYEAGEENPEEREQFHDVHRHIANHHDVEKVANRLNKLNHTLEIVEERLRHVEHATGVEIGAGNPTPGPSEKDVLESGHVHKNPGSWLSFKL